MPSEARLPSVRPCSKRSRARLLGEVARDVVEHQHEAVQRRVAGRLGADRAHRRHLHAQQLPGARAGDELRRRVRHAALQPLLDALERVRDQLAVEHRVDRAAEPDQLAAVGERAVRSSRRTKLQARAVVVEQDATVEVADDDALRQLGHQRREPAALLLDLAAGFLRLARAMSARSASRWRASADHLGERAGRAGVGAAAAASVALERLAAASSTRGVLGEARRRDRPSARTGGMRPSAPNAAASTSQSGSSSAARGASSATSAARSAASSVAANKPSAAIDRPHQAASSAAVPGAERRGEHPWRRSQLHARPSSSRTVAASSRVENGLVT